MDYQDKKSGFKFDAVSGVPKENTVEAFEELFSANKAAEEGGLVQRLRAQAVMPFGPEGFALLVEAADALDRASRQVANVPSEIAKVLGLHEPVSVVCAVQAIKALMPVRQVANKAEVERPYEALSNLITYRPVVVRGEAMMRSCEDEDGKFVELADVKLLLDHAIKAIGSVRHPVATPPATTGASTVRNQALEDAAKACEGEAVEITGHPSDDAYNVAIEHSAAAIRALKGLAPASTVLTDERVAFEDSYIDRVKARDPLRSYSEEEIAMHLARNSSNESRYLHAQEAWEGWQARAKVAAQAGQVAVPADMTAAADFIDKRAEQYLQDHADSEPGTGAIAFEFGEAGREYHSTLVELADDLRQASAPAVCAVPPPGWHCTRKAGHEGPCAAIQRAAQLDGGQGEGAANG